MIQCEGFLILSVLITRTSAVQNASPYALIRRNALASHVTYKACWFTPVTAEDKVKGCQATSPTREKQLSQLY